MGEKMILLNKDDLLEIEMDLSGIANMLVVIEASEYYTEEDKSVFRTVRNCIECTKSKFNNLIESAKETV